MLYFNLNQPWFFEKNKQPQERLQESQMKISLGLFGNTFHANHLSSRMQEIDSERYGLPVFRKYGIPATTFFQGVDLLMKPWLKEEMSLPGSIEWGQSMFSHTMIPLFDNNNGNEIELGTKGSVPITFFSEFCVPRPENIPTRFTLVLAGNSVLYSACSEFWSQRQGDIYVEQYPKSPSIRFGNKIGILMREESFGQFLRALFLFQRYPIKGSHPGGTDCLAALVDEVKRIDRLQSDSVIVCPVDIEAPWIGSNFGSQAWEIFFEELATQDLTDVFAPLSRYLEQFEREAVKTARPHRELTKWANWELQLEHMKKLERIPAAKKDEREMLKMIATGSDIFAAWGIRFMETRKKIFLDAADTKRCVLPVPITYNQAVVEVQLAAYRALFKKSPFLEELGEVAHVPENDYFIRTAVEMARRESF